MEDKQYRIPSREEILALDDLPTEMVPVPEWGADVAVQVRGMSAEERLQWSKKINGPDGKTDVEKAQIYAIIVGVVEPQFTMEDYDALKKKSGAALDRISRVWMRLSGLGEREAAEIRGNSLPATS